MFSVGEAPVRRSMPGIDLVVHGATFSGSLGMRNEVEDGFHVCALV